ncbi:MAG TPA: MBG domain-containing protein [Terriglobia bacterium]|nr:MBG domain-containing protein [Terriglobia bacterium]
MRKPLYLLLVLACSALAFGQAGSVPTCNGFNGSGVPINTGTGSTNCTDFFGVANWANSPLPTGSVTSLTLVEAGSGYTNPVVTITDLGNAGGTGATATATVDASGAITGIKGAITGFTISSGGTNYYAPQVTIVDSGCGLTGQPACGSGAMASAAIGGSLAGGVRKFVDALPNLPMAVPDTVTFPGSDYYVIALQQYTAKLHSDIPSTTLRGYVQLNSGTDGSGNNTIAPPPIQYLGPLIIAQKDRPVRILFKNMLPVGSGGNLFIPVDTTYMGAGMDGNTGTAYTQNRATLHLHGGATPWISDGTPHQWTVPAGETAGPARGDSTQDVPDMWFDASGNVIAGCAAQPSCATVGATNNPGAGNMTFFWTNQQGGRLMFYHDHAYGITRLNVYAGEAAGYLLLDPKEEDALANASAPGTIGSTTAPDLAHLVPLVIQDKTFVPGTAQMSGEDPTWAWGGFGTTPGAANEGDLWFPHVYTPNQNPSDLGGANAFGRWDYGPWFHPPQTTLTAANPPTAVTIACTSVAFPGQILQAPSNDLSGGGCPIIMNPSGTPEGFMDTPLVNGEAYPVLKVDPAAYRFQILSAGNDRSLNLSLFVADSTGMDVAMVPAVPPGPGNTTPLCTTVTQLSNPTLDIGQAQGTLDSTGSPLNGTGLPASCWPNYGPQTGIPTKQSMWAADGRDGGVPDPRNAGPPFIQIGSEGGLLPSPVVIPATPTNYEYNTRSVTVTNVGAHGLWLGPAERADVIVDFSKFAGQTLILYNDAPTPAPAFDSRLDYYTGDLDQTSIGGAPPTQPGYGPNTRTIMQIVVGKAGSNTTPFSLPALTQAFTTTTAGSGLFAATQPTTIVPESAYNTAYNGSFSNTYARLNNNTMTFTPITGASVLPDQPCSAAPPAVCDTFDNKTIQELFTTDYGRMNATLGTELPFTSFLNQTTIPLGYIDPPSEIISNGQTQIWKITHNGVDTHFIHFHLFNVQVINRIGWDGSVRPPDFNELGWKDTVRMNPLEITMVALQPIKPNPPWPVRDSYRLFDVTAPLGGTTQFTNINPFTSRPATTPNAIYNFGWEYVWHCHILGHEENDMMRPIAFQVPPEAPANVAANWNPWGANPAIGVTWTDMSASETGFTLERADDAGFTLNPFTASLPASQPLDANNQGTGWGGTMTYNDTSANLTLGSNYFYRVQSFKPDANYWNPPNVDLLSPWSIASVSVLPATTASAIVASSPITYGNSATVTVNVTSPQGGPVTGNVQLTVSGGPTLVNSITQSLAGNPGSTTFSLSGLAAGTYNLDATYTVPGSLTGVATGSSATTVQLVVNPAALTLTASSATITYGEAVPTITATGNFVNGDTLASLATQPACVVVGLPANNPAGSYTTQCSGAASPNYSPITYATGTLTINPAPLVITAGNGTMTYGGTVPAITPAFSGFVNGDTSAALTTQPICSTTATGTSNVGSYPSTCSGAAAANYSISYVAGSVTVSAASLTITAGNGAMTYGGTVPTITPAFSGFVLGQNSSVLTTQPTCTTTATPTSPVNGTYTSNCSGAVAPNYTVTYVAGTVTISPAPLTITAGSGTMVYGGTVPAITPGFAGFVNGETSAVLTAQPTCSTTATPASPVSGSPYPSTCSGATAANYAISYVAGSVSVNQAPLTITASGGTMVYGGTVPAITPGFAGFVNGDTSAVLAPQPTCSTTATPTSPVGGSPYPSTCSGAGAANYAISYVAGTVTISKANPTVTFTGAPASAPYLSTFSVVASSNSTTTSIPVLTASGSCSIAGNTVTMSSGTGICTMTADWAADPNYNAATLTQSTTAAKIAPTVTFTGAPASAVYNSTFTVASSTNASTAAVITASGACSIAGNTVSMTSGTGTCSLAANWAADNNFNAATASQTTAALQATSTSSITSNVPNPSNIGQAVTISFQVTGNGSPTGSVTVSATTGESCAATLAAGAGSCTITFNTSGTRTLTAGYAGDSNFAASTSAGVSQTVNAAGASVSPTSLTFANQTVNTTSAGQTVTLTNTGTTTLTSIVVSLAGSDFTLTNNCGTTLAAGRNCTFTLRFKPLSSGAKTGTVTVSSSAPTLTVPLSGTGVAPINSVSPTSLTFSGPVNVTSAAQTVTVTNTGTANLTINSITRTGTNANQFAQTNNCGGTFPATLPVGSSCTINVTFTPTSGNPLTKTATLNVNVAAPATSAAVSLTGTVVVPTYTVSPTSLSFGNQTIHTTSAAQTVTVTNTGTVALIINSITRGGTNGSQFGQTNTCPIGGAGLAGGSTCTINVTFTPTTRGAKSATLNVNPASPATTQSVSLSGTGQ